MNEGNIVKNFNCSLTVDLRGLSGKQFKVTADLIRSAIKQEHGYNGTKGLKDTRLSMWPVAIRFQGKQNRENFKMTLSGILSTTLFGSIMKDTRPVNSNPKPIRIIRCTA
jgi:hypothetical protein